MAIKLLKIGEQMVKRLEQTDAWLTPNMKKFRLCNCEQLFDHQAKLQLLQYKGVFLVSLKGIEVNQSEATQNIVFDASANIVLYWVEDCDLNMDLLIYTLYVGNDAKFCFVTKLKRLAVQPNEKRPKN